MVLLKNDGTLPLKPGIKKIAVIGPLAEQTRVLLGNYSGTPTHSVSVLDGLKAEFPECRNHVMSRERSSWAAREIRCPTMR